MPKPSTDRQKKFGNVFIPILIGCCALFVIFWAYLEPPNQRHYNPASSNEANPTYEESTTVSKLPPNVNAKAKTTEEYTEKDKESFAASRSDLAEQWAMAHYTFVGLIIGLVGIGFIIWTVIETKGAAFFAEQTLKETKNNSRRELKAYLSTKIFVHNTYRSDTADFDICVTNFGQTPAKKVGVNLRVDIHGANFPKKTGSNFGGIMINPNEEITFKKTMNLGILKRSNALAVAVNIEYMDIYNQTRFHKTVHHIAVEEIPKMGHTIKIKASDTERVANPNYVAKKELFFFSVDSDLNN